MDSNKPIFALILAAGQSKRMKQPKIVLPWGKTTIIGHIIHVFNSAGICDVFVVTGGYREEVEHEVTKAGGNPIFNPNHSNDELTISLNIGLENIHTDQFSAGFISLGDQPNLHREDIEALIKKHYSDPGKIIIPSYQMRRGHPWLVPAIFMDEMAKLAPPDTLRDFINKHNNDIEYVVVDHADILSDLDTPEDYERLKPR